MPVRLSPWSQHRRGYSCQEKHQRETLSLEATAEEGAQPQTCATERRNPQLKDLTRQVRILTEEVHGPVAEQGDRSRTGTANPRPESSIYLLGMCSPGHRLSANAHNGRASGRGYETAVVVSLL